MKKYRVEVTASAEQVIYEHARFIAADKPDAAARWLVDLFAKIDTLDTMFRRNPLAPENVAKPYEVRKMNFGDYLVLYTIDDPARIVWVIGFRRGERQSRPEGLPSERPTA